ncbi:hypothetical protein FJY90_07400 [Candidatus Gottesmanbacteria bacterium]|nr:hypothetical protein [Candidatus Gottesmanbacteria bacterium]
MQNNRSFTTNRNPWRDDHPEKLSQSFPRTIGFKQQVKGLFSPNKMLNQVFGEKGRESFFPPYAKERPTPAKRENLVFSYEMRQEEKLINEETKIILQKLKEQVILLEKSEKSLVSEVSKIKVEQLPKKSSIYYLRFLEWLLTVVHQLRLKVEDGRAWLSTFSSRKKKRFGYWQMYKKHGTTFGLSYERTLATQTG